MMDRDTRIFYLAAFVAFLLLALSFALPVICEGQTLDDGCYTIGFDARGNVVEPVSEVSSQGILDISGIPPGYHVAKEENGFQTIVRDDNAPLVNVAGPWPQQIIPVGNCGPSPCGPRGCPAPGFPPQTWNPPPASRFNSPARQQPQRSSNVKRIASVVFIKSTITTNAMAGESEGKLGSGTYIGNGYVITCGHILREGWKPVVYFANTGLPDKPFPATIIAADASIDLGLLRIAPLTNDADYAMLLAQSNPKIGETVWWAGFGQGSFSAGPGRVTQYVGQEIRINTTVRNGDSGGPLFTSAGLVGVISEGEVGVDIGGASVEYIRQWIAEVRGDEKPPDSTESPGATGERPSTSVEGSPITVEAPATGNGPVPPVAPGGAAERLADSIDALRAEMAAINAGSSVDVKQEVSQAVTVQMQDIGNQIVERELVPLKNRVTQLELKQQAMDVALAGCVSGSGAKGEKGERGEQGPQGEQGPPGKDAVVDYDAIVGLVLDRLPKQPQATDGLYADLVYDSDGDYWAWMRPEAEQAKAQFSLRLVEAPEGHDFGTLPQLVFYRSGTPIKRVAGSSDVWQMLSMIRGGKDLVLKE